MNKTIGIVVPVLLALSLSGCSAQIDGSALSPQPSSELLSLSSSQIKGTQEDLKTAPTDLGLLVESYYSGQDSRAFRMFQKSIFRKLVDSWTSDELENPVWNYDSFARYYVLEQDMDSDNPNEELYYCTFSADHDKCGYIVLSYNGDGLSRVRAVETLYLYDLQANIEDVAELLQGTELDLASAQAFRVQMVDSDMSSAEAILIRDANGNSCVCDFGEEGILHRNASFTTS